MLFKMTTKQLAVFLIDAILISLSLFLSYALRFNTLTLGTYLGQMLMILPLMLALRLGVFVVMGLYRGMWRFTGMRDLIAVIQAVSMSSGIVMAVLFLAFRLDE